MEKKYFVFSFLLLISLVVVGCTNNSQKSDNNQNNSQPNQTRENNNQKDRFEENFVELTVEDLQPGQIVMAMGIENSDKSVLVDRIVLGDKNTDFNETGRGFMPRANNELDSQNNGENQAPQFDPAQRLDFQNMTDEERQAFREQMMANGGMENIPQPNRVNTDQSYIRLVGEIIDLNESSITLKLEVGGSRLVFFSGTMKVLEPKDVNSDAN